MSNQIISKRTLNRFADVFSNSYVLGTIRRAFEECDIECNENYVPECSGERRTLVAQFYASLDLSNGHDVKRLLPVFEDVLSNADPSQLAGLVATLEKDGFTVKNGRIFRSTGTPSLEAVRNAADLMDWKHLRDQIDRMRHAVDTDPQLAIGTAKELIESCCRTILKERGKPVTGTPDIPTLTKSTLRELELIPEGVPDQAKGVEVIKRLLSNLGTIAHGIAELRGLYGTGHGKDGAFRGLSPRHAKLAAGAATTLAEFLFETHKERSKTS